jgi:hypothetical protein
VRGIGEDLDDADVGERVDANLGIVELLAELERLRAPRQGLFGVFRDRVQVPEVDVGEGQLAPPRQPLEARDGLVADLGGLLGAAEKAIQARERAQAVGLRQLVDGALRSASRPARGGCTR